MTEQQVERLITQINGLRLQVFVLTCVAGFSLGCLVAMVLRP